MYFGKKASKIDVNSFENRLYYLKQISKRQSLDLTLYIFIVVQLCFFIGFLLCLHSEMSKLECDQGTLYLAVLL